MTPASQPHVVRLRSGDLVRVRQVRPGDASAVVSAYAHLGEQACQRAARARAGKRASSFCVRRALKADPLASHKGRIMEHLRSSDWVGRVGLEPTTGGL